MSAMARPVSSIRSIRDCSSKSCGVSNCLLYSLPSLLKISFLNSFHIFRFLSMSSFFSFSCLVSLLTHRVFPCCQFHAKSAYICKAVLYYAFCLSVHRPCIHTLMQDNLR